MSTAVIINPKSGSRDFQSTKDLIITTLNNLQVDFSMHETRGTLDATHIARKLAQQGCERILAVGGDGTMVEVVNGIIGTTTKLAVIPNGTGNLLASSLGIPEDIEKSCYVALKGNTTFMDVGKMNNKHFIVMAGCGYDASIMENVGRLKKKFFGKLAYFLEGVYQAFRYRRSVFKIVADGVEYKTRAVGILVVNNGKIFGSSLSISPFSKNNDGYLDLCILKPKSAFDFLPGFVQLVTLKKNADLKYIQHIQAKEIYVECRPKLKVQADGDIMSQLPLHIQTVPKAVQVITP